MQKQPNGKKTKIETRSRIYFEVPISGCGVAHCGGVTLLPADVFTLWEPRGEEHGPWNRDRDVHSSLFVPVFRADKPMNGVTFCLVGIPPHSDTEVSHC